MNDANDSPLAAATDERPDVPPNASACAAAAGHVDELRGTATPGASQSGPGAADLAAANNQLTADQRWCDLDPTNNRSGWHAPGEDYVTLATGRDFGDVSPIRGVIHGGASHALRVDATVEPSPPEPRGPARSQQQAQSQSQGQA